jgi:stress-induced morphogen
VSSPEIGPNTPMAEILAAYPSAKVGLFQRYHIGGCASCGYQPHDTLQEVCSTHDIADPLDAVIACIRESEAVEATLHIRPAQVAAALEGGDKLILLDVRAPEEWEAGHIEGAQLATVELTFEILDTWPKDTPLVLYSNHGNRSLDRASYFRAYGLTNPRSMDGGLEAWLALGGPSEEIRRYLARAFPGARVAAADATGAGDHFAVTIVSRAFEGKALVERHRMVYSALDPLMARIHALQLKTVSPGEA